MKWTSYHTCIEAYTATDTERQRVNGLSTITAVEEDHYPWT